MAERLADQVDEMIGGKLKGCAGVEECVKNAEGVLEILGSAKRSPKRPPTADASTALLALGAIGFQLDEEQTTVLLMEWFTNAHLMTNAQLKKDGTLFMLQSSLVDLVDVESFPNEFFRMLNEMAQMLFSKKAARPVSPSELPNVGGSDKQMSRTTRVKNFAWRFAGHANNAGADGGKVAVLAKIASGVGNIGAEIVKKAPGIAKGAIISSVVMTLPLQAAMLGWGAGVTATGLAIGSTLTSTVPLMVVGSTVLRRFHSAWTDTPAAPYGATVGDTDDEADFGHIAGGSVGAARGLETAYSIYGEK